MNQPLKLLAVLPHPDDESLGMGGTYAKYSAEGVETYLVCATRGERGWTGPAEENPGLAALGRIREGELRCACAQLGIHGLTLLDYIDGDLDQANPAEIIGKLTAQVRRIRPQVVVTFPPDGIYGHPDHIAMGQFTAAALVCAADAAYQDPESQAPFRVPKFYHMADPKSLVDSFRAQVGPLGIEVDGEQREHFGWQEWAISARIDVRAYFNRTWQAILCHQSQLPAYGPLVSLPYETREDFWATGTFVRIYSLVSGGRQVETDLFAGLR